MLEKVAGCNLDTILDETCWMSIHWRSGAKIPPMRLSGNLLVYY